MFREISSISIRVVLVERICSEPILRDPTEGKYGVALQVWNKNKSVRLIYE